MADLIISQPMTFTVDVRNGLVERPQRESLMRGDKMANRIIAELMYGSEPFDITGVTVKGVFCRPPNGDEIELYGEAEGNVARVQLTDQCYTSGGHYEARVILEFNGVERTVLFISGDVLKSGSGNTAGNEETGGTEGNTGSGLPTGGTAGQVLVKVSSAQGDAIWKNLTAADVGARPDDWMPTAADVGARPDDWMPTAADVGALPSDGTAVNANALNGKSADQYLTTDKVVNNFTTTEEGFIADARALKILDDKIGKPFYESRFDAGARVVITFNSYATSALIFAAQNNSAAFALLYSNGYLSPIVDSKIFSYQLSADYKTVTINNPAGGSLYTRLGVLHLGNANMSIQVEAIS